MKINEDGRWGTPKLSNTFWPRSLQGPEHADSGYVHVFPAFLDREQPVFPWEITESMVAFLRHHQACRQSQCTRRKNGALRRAGSNAWSEERFPPGFAGGRRREAGAGPWLLQGCGTHRRLSRPGDMEGHAGMDAWPQPHPGLQ